MTQNNYNLMEQVVEVLSNRESEGMAKVFGMIINQAMKIERNKALGADPYERSEERTGYANGFKPKTISSRVGKIKLQIPQVRGGLEFYPSSIEKGNRSERALKLAIAEMYIKGVSTRKVSAIVEQLCGTEVSSSQVSKVAALLDEEIAVWRKRELGQYKYLLIDATYEKVREGVSVVSCAVLTAYGIDSEGTRTVLGVATALSEAEVYWREFLLSLKKRGLHGVELITSDDHSGLRKALEACFPGVPWQRCQFHLQRNAAKHVPKIAMRAEIATDIRTVFNSPNREEADRYLQIVIEKYKDVAPSLSEWLEANIPEGLTVFQLPEGHRRKLRTTNMVERQNKEIKRRTKVATIFPNLASLLRLVSALLMETSEQWGAGRQYLNMD